MKRVRILILLLGFIINLSYPPKIYANFIKYINNPIIKVGTNKEWDNVHVYGPALIFENSIYRVWYSGSNGANRQIGYAESTNPLQLTKYPNNPILPWDLISLNDMGVEHPTIIKNASFGEYPYKMWFSNMSNNLKISEMYYSSSKDGINWTNPIRIVFNIPPYTTWDSFGEVTGAPSVIYDSNNNIFHLWYAGKGTFNNVIRWRIGYASSNDGINWIKHPNPVLQADKSWEGSDVANPSVLVDENGVYYMFYHGDWGIGYATSTDGIYWDKGIDNLVLIPTDGTFDTYRVLNPFVMKSPQDNKIYLYYTGASGSYNGIWQIGLATSDVLPSPFPTSIYKPTPTETPIVTPSTTPISSTPGLSPTTTPTVSPTIAQQTPTITSSPTVTPTFSTTPTPLIKTTPTTLLTPSPSPTNPITPITITPSPTPFSNLSPTPTSSKGLFSPIIILPGMGASWNPKDIFSCNTSSSDHWEMAPYVFLYNRLVKTIILNSGLQQNKDFFVYTYDWRQPLDVQGEMLKNYIDNILRDRPAGTKVNLVGHSLGGLVIRSYIANNPETHKVEKAMTVGTPHQGSILSYPIWEKGEVWTDDKLTKIAVSQVINYCRFKLAITPGENLPSSIRLKNSREVVQKVVPSAKSVLPIFDYIRENGVVKSSSSLKNQNLWLSLHPFPQNFTSNFLSTLSGNNVNTLRYLDVTKPNTSEIAAGDWIDGKPTNKEKISEGDGSVLNLSSQLESVDNQSVNGDHGKIISTNEGIIKIMKFLGLPTTQIAAETIPPEIASEKILSISLDGQAIMKLTDPLKKTSETEEDIFVTYNPEAGVYKLRIIPSETKTGYIYMSQINGDVYSDKIYRVKLFKNRTLDYLLFYSPRVSPLPRLVEL